MFEDNIGANISPNNYVDIKVSTAASNMREKKKRNGSSNLNVQKMILRA